MRQNASPPLDSSPSRRQCVANASGPELVRTSCKAESRTLVIDAVNPAASTAAASWCSIGPSRIGTRGLTWIARCRQGVAGPGDDCAHRRRVVVQVTDAGDIGPNVAALAAAAAGAAFGRR